MLPFVLQLGSYLSELGEDMIKSGNLEGILVTGNIVRLTVYFHFLKIACASILFYYF